MMKQSNYLLDSRFRKLIFDWMKDLHAQFVLHTKASIHMCIYTHTHMHTYRAGMIFITAIFHVCHACVLLSWYWGLFCIPGFYFYNKCLIKDAVRHKVWSVSDR